MIFSQKATSLSAGLIAYILNGSMMKIGTSGYSYEDWKDIFYPSDMQSKDFLGHYCRFFNITEINSTYYRIPNPRMFIALLRKVPEEFQFAVKLSQEFTHQREQMEESIKPFRGGIQPLIGNDRLTVLLAQFPYSFKPNENNYQHLARLRETFPDIPIQVEFRNKYWITENTFDFLREHDLGYVCVDMPRLPKLVPPTVQATTDLGYVRFHGRSTKHWWNAPEPYMRYDYLYTNEVLQEWVPKIKQLRKQTDQVLLFFNNHYQAQSAKNAVSMAQLLNLSPPEIRMKPEKISFPVPGRNTLF